MKELCILKTRTEIETHDIFEMGDYLGEYINSFAKGLSKDDFLDIKINPLTISVLTEIVNYGMSFKNECFYVPNFDALPKEFKDGLNKGKYKLGESRIVEGDVRAVLVDEDGIRVKDVTLKEVNNTPNNIDAVRNIMLQIQMKQINEKLDSLEKMLQYIIQKNRSGDLIEPFFKARGYLVDAQKTEDEQSRTEYLNKAIDLLKGVIQAGYQDLRISAEGLADNTKRALFRNDKELKTFINNVCEDFYVVNISMGLQLLIYDYLEKNVEKNNAMNEYFGFMNEFCQKPIGSQGIPAIDILQNNFPYKSNNRDMWLNFKEKIGEVENRRNGIESDSKTYLISMEA